MDDITNITNIEYCDLCGRLITAAEQALGWPVEDPEDGYVCPSCYGDEAWCDICGELLPATDDLSRCPECCAEKEERHERA